MATPTEQQSDAPDEPRAAPTLSSSAVLGLPSGQVKLRPRKSRPFFGRHPWVLDTAIDRIEGDPTDGDVVDLISDTGKFIARGILNRGSRLRVRLFTWHAGEPLHAEFFAKRIETAVRFRARLGLDRPQGGCRLVFSESDGLSGLVVDRFADCLVVQINSLAIAARLPWIVEALTTQLKPRAILTRPEAGVGRLESFAPPSGPLYGTPPDGPVFLEEHGLRYGADLSTGQKTGYYLDQRENRRAAAGYLRERRVLDMFCYSGGFSLSAARLGGAREVIGVDGSERAVTLARANAALNGVSNVQFHCHDGFDCLEEFAQRRERFEAVILDPPKFTKSRRSVDDALRAYHRINRRAVDLLTPDGILVTCSCSGSVTREDFVHMLSGVAQQSGRDIQILEQRGAAPDHPVTATCLETDYLKCFICRVL